MKIFAALSPTALAERELLEARRALLVAQSAQEYAASIVAFNTARIARLQEYLHDDPNQPRKNNA